MRITFLAFLLISLTIKSISQTNSPKSVYGHLDTIETHSVFLEASYGGETAHYFVNGKEVEKRIYDRFDISSNKFLLCKPCILKVYDTDNILLTISTRYSDCSIGSYTEFYHNGKIKIKGQFKENDTGDWTNLDNRGYCSIREGDWSYYSFWGHLMRIETYVNNKLVTTKKVE